MANSSWAAPASLADVAKLEEQLAAVLNDTAGEVAHAECFDVEQRAEVYAILRALQSDSNAHRTLLSMLSRGSGGGPADA